MSNQYEIWSSEEGDNWLDRNREKLQANAKNDPVMRAMDLYDIHCTKVLEVGCSNGWRLDRIRRKYNAKCYGIDVSEKALDEGTGLYPEIKLLMGEAACFPDPLIPPDFDLVIMGFCLYALDRSDLFAMAAEVDRHLQDDGHLVIYDFYPNWPHSKPYSHHPGLKTYKMRHDHLFTANPAYHQIGRLGVGDEESVVILRKRINLGWPMREDTVEE